MKSWSIFSHSIGMVLRNFQQAVQIGLVPVLIAFLAVAAALTVSGVSVATLGDEAALQQLMAENAGSIGFGAFLLAFLMLVTMLWIVVSWHRFVLLEEYPQGWVPPFRFDRILSYIGHGLLIGLVAMLAMIPVGLAAALLGTIVPVLSAVAVVLGVIAVSVVVYRLVPVLPAAAIGKPLKLKQAWAATDGANGTIFGLVIIMFLFQIAVQLAAGVLSFVPVIGPIVVYAASLVLSLVNVSILTTFYGHYVEGRPV